MKEYKGTVISLKMVKDDWYIGTIELEDGSSVPAVGSLDGIKRGQRVILYAEEVEHPKYGKQLKVSGSSPDIPASEQGIIAFLSGGYIKGVGHAKAMAIYERFGKETINVIRDTPERLTEVSGIKERTAEKISESFKENFAYLELLTATKGFLTQSQISKLREKYEERALQIILNNPYQIIRDIPGFGFRTADNIAQSAGIDRYSVPRVGAAINHALLEAAENGGHCYQYKDSIISSVLGLLTTEPKISDVTDKVAENIRKAWLNDNASTIKKYSLSEQNVSELSKWESDRMIFLPLFDRALDEEISSGSIYQEEERLYQKLYYNAEKTCAELLARILTSTDSSSRISPSDFSEVLDTVGAHLNAEQKQGALYGMRERISVLTGGPGTGKTATIRTAATGYTRFHGKDSVILLAPTGRAAQRITESSGLPAMTIHRFIQAYKEAPPKGNLIIVDEMSMTDIILFSQLLKVAKNCSFMFVGDIDQLPSVGAGAVLRDLLNTESIPNTHLIHVFRNAGSIAYNAHAVNAGERRSRLQYDKQSLYVRTTKDNIQAAVIGTFNNAVKKYGLLNTFLLVPMRKRGCISINSLNELLQEAYTKGRKELVVGSSKFREGDRVINVKNEYNRPTSKEEGGRTIPGLGVFNGELGMVKEVFPDDNALTVKFDDGRTSRYSGIEISSLELAYAMTVHKSQGSEAKVVIFACAMENFVMLKRNLVYTAITRAKEAVCLIDEVKDGNNGLSALDMGIRNIDDRIRLTTLSQRTEELIRNEKICDIPEFML